MVDKVDVREGYKKTEVGVIPEDWGVESLEMIANIIDPHPSHRAPKVDTKGIPFIGIGDISEQGDINYDTARYVNEQIYNEHKNRYDLTKGLIGIGRVASIGKVIKFKKNIGKYTVSPTIAIIDAKNIDNELIFHLLNSKYVNKQFLSMSNGSTRQSVGIMTLRKVILPIPKYENEQKKICEALTDTDKLINSIEKLIDKKEKIKQGTMQELLTGKKRLDGFSGEWEVKELEELSDIKTGKKDNKDKVEDGEYPFFVRSQHIERINSYSYEGEAILIPGEGGIGSIYHYINSKFDYHQRVYKISDFKCIDGKYIYYFMKQNFNEHAMRNSVKATVDSLRLPTFQDFQIYFPPSIKEQKAISQILSDMDQEIESLKEKLEKYKKLKQGMMQELLTGRIRLI